MSILSLVPAEIWMLISGFALSAVTYIFGIRKGASNANAHHEAQKGKDYADTRKRIDEVDSPADRADAVDRLRRREGQ